MISFPKPKRKNNTKYLYSKKKEEEKLLEIKKGVKEVKGSSYKEYATNIAIITLKKGIGSSHFAKGIQTFLEDSMLITSKEEEQEIIDNTRIYDLGEYYGLNEWQKNAFIRADIRLVLVTYDMDNISDLMEFVKEYEDNCIYLFNFVPEEVQKEVHEMMEDYETYCIPLFQKEKLNKKIKKIFKEIV